MQDVLSLVWFRHKMPLERSHVMKAWSEADGTDRWLAHKALTSSMDHLAVGQVRISMSIIKAYLERYILPRSFLANTKVVSLPHQTLSHCVLCQHGSSVTGSGSH